MFFCTTPTYYSTMFSEKDAQAELTARQKSDALHLNSCRYIKSLCSVIHSWCTAFNLLNFVLPRLILFLILLVALVRDKIALCEAQNVLKA